MTTETKEVRNAKMGSLWLCRKLFSVVSHKLRRFRRFRLRPPPSILASNRSASSLCWRSTSTFSLSCSASASNRALNVKIKTSKIGLFEWFLTCSLMWRHSSSQTAGCALLQGVSCFRRLQGQNSLTFFLQTDLSLQSPVWQTKVHLKGKSVEICRQRKEIGEKLTCDHNP